jgi:glycosyltransferase involved in cell wall biosynthesis
LDTLELKYYASPDEYPETQWANGRVFFYWNRSGLVGKDFLLQFCRSLEIDRMIYRRDAHSRIPAGMDFSLPDRLGNTRVQTVPLSQWPPRNEYTEVLSRANIFLAPRTSEGVGLAFLEAMAQGCAVFAYDAATMNEYITHRGNGFLFRKYGRSVWNDARGRAGGRMENLRKRFGVSPGRLPYPVSGMQDWSEIRKLDPKKLGDNARESQQLGFQEWTNAIPKYASFILDW